MRTDLVILVYFVGEGVGRHGFGLLIVQQRAGLSHTDVGLVQISRCGLKERSTQTLTQRSANLASPGGKGTSKPVLIGGEQKELVSV